MTRKRIVLIFWITSMGHAVWAQQNIGFRQAGIISPLVNEAGTIIFKLRAPLARTARDRQLPLVGVGIGVSSFVFANGRVDSTCGRANHDCGRL